MQLDRDVPLEDGDWVDVNPQDTEVCESVFSPDYTQPVLHDGLPACERHQNNASPVIDMMG